MAKPTLSRPNMPEGYGIEPSETTDMVPWEFIRERLTAARSYWVSTTRPDGRPHAMPVWGLWLDDVFYFSTDPDSRKGKNLTANPNVVVHLESGDEVAIVEGVAEKTMNLAVRRQFADAYDVKYQVRPDPDDPDTLIYGVRPKVVLAWGEQDFPQSATRWTFSD